MKAVGIDIGTMFFQTAEYDLSSQIKYKTIRNCFIELAKTDDIHEMLRQNKFQWIEDERNVYVIGEDAIRFARMLPGKVELRRPLQNGVLNPGEEMKTQVLNELIRSTIGKAEDDKCVACFCVSSPPVDSSPNNTFHEKRLRGIFENHGWKVQVIEEGLSVVLSECPTIVDSDGTEIPYTGIGISFGAGRVNVVLAYKGVSAVGMSAGRSGDWIDTEVSVQTNIPIAQVTNFKEQKLDFDKVNVDNDLEFALDAYYSAMLEYVMQQFSTKFATVKSDFEKPLDIIVAGGTSMPKGFINKFDKVVRRMDLPFKIKEIRHAKDPRNAVCKGLLTRAVITMKQLSKSSTEDLLKSDK